MIKTCCDKEGFCPTYQRELWGRQWRVVHGIEGTESEQQYYCKMLGSPLPAPVTVQSVPAVAKTKKVRKPCGCGQRKIGPL